MRLFAKVTAFVVMAVMGGSVTLVALPEAASAQEDTTATACASELSLAVPSDEERGKTPVLMVHGYTADAATWSKGNPSMEDVVRFIDDSVLVDPFDYEAQNTKWVSGSGAAHRLAEEIVCYSKLYGKRVIVVAHSMGGLLAAEAFDWAVFGVFVKDAGGHLVTLGSPYEGSWLAAGYNTGDMSFCTVLTGGNVNLCRDAYAGQATSGLSINSDQLAALPELPEGVTHKAIAGRAKYEMCFWGCAEFDLGDLVVPIDSATARSTDTGDGDGVTVFDCWISEGWCSHGAMLQAEPVQQEVKASIEAYLASIAEPDFDPDDPKWRLVMFDRLAIPDLGQDWTEIHPYGGFRFTFGDVSDCVRAYVGDCPQVSFINLNEVPRDRPDEWMAWMVEDDPVIAGFQRWCDVDRGTLMDLLEARTVFIGDKPANFYALDTCPDRVAWPGMYSWHIPSEGLLVTLDGSQSGPFDMEVMEESLRQAEWF